MTCWNSWPRRHGKDITNTKNQHSHLRMFAYNDRGWNKLVSLDSILCSSVFDGHSGTPISWFSDWEMSWGWMMACWSTIAWVCFVYWLELVTRTAHLAVSHTWIVKGCISFFIIAIGCLFSSSNNRCLIGLWGMGYCAQIVCQRW